MKRATRPSPISSTTYWFYGAGALGNAAIGFIANSWLLYYYVPPQGATRIPVALFGITALIGYAILAILNPWIGYRSDNLRSANLRSAMGRRLPFMLAALLPSLIFFILLWIPPIEQESHWNLVYLIVIFALFKTASSFYQVPHQALLADLATTERERVRFSTWQAAFMLLGFTLGSLAGLALDAWGYRITTLLYAALALPALCLPLLVARQAQNTSPLPTQIVNFRISLLATLRNHAFLSFAACWALFMMTTTLIQAAIPYITTQICLLSPADTLQLYLPGLLVSLACYPLAARLAGRLGKRRVFAGALLASAIVFPGIMLVGTWLPIPLGAQCISWAVLQAAGAAGVSALGAAFVAEIAETELLASGQRQEGLYFAMLKVFDQVFTGMAGALLPLLLLLGRSQAQAQGALGVRLTGLAAGALALMAWLLFRRFSSLIVNRSGMGYSTDHNIIQNATKDRT